jgi:hypothetical protein
MPVNRELIELLGLAGLGAAGALVGVIVKTGRLMLPRVVHQNGEGGDTVTLIDLGCFSSLFLGAAAAVYFDGGPRWAVWYGFLSGTAGAVVLNAILEPLLRRIGLPSLPNPEPPS